MVVRIVRGHPFRFRDRVLHLQVSASAMSFNRSNRFPSNNNGSLIDADVATTTPQWAIDSTIKMTSGGLAWHVGVEIKVGDDMHEDIEEGVTSASTQEFGSR